MNNAPFTLLYGAIAAKVNDLGVPTFSASQDAPGKLPMVRVQLLNGDATGRFKNADEYQYAFQLDVITAQDGLEQGLNLAYKIRQNLPQVVVEGYLVSEIGRPSITSMIDSSTNRILNRQILRVNYTMIEQTAF